MAIEMCVTQEIQGERVAGGSLPWEPPNHLLNLRDTPLLVAALPWSDVIFNEFQCSQQLPREIAYLREQLPNENKIAMIDELERLAETATAEPHRYLGFVGD